MLQQDSRDRRHHRRTRRNLAACTALISALAIAASPAPAATKFWDLFSAGANNGSIDNGSGLWDTLFTLNWTSDGGATNTTWSNNDDAVFGGDPGVGAAGAIALSGTINANSVTFNPTASGNFSLSGGTALNLTGAGGFITANADASIASILGGSAGLTKAGAGMLALTGANTISGAVVVNNGTVTLSGASGALGSASSYTINSGATLGLYNAANANADRLANAAITMNGGTLSFFGASGLTETTGNLFLASGMNTVELSGAGTTTLAFGSLNRSPGATVNFVAAGSARRVTFNNVTPHSFISPGAYIDGAGFAWYDAEGYVRAINYGVDTNTATTMFNPRHVRLSASETRSSLTILSLNLAFGGVNVNFSNNTSITISTGGLLKSGGGGSFIQGGNENPGTLTTGLSTEWIIAAADASDMLTISKILTGGNALTKSGSGTLALNNAGNNYGGTTTIAGGTLQIATAESIPNTSPVVVAAGATFDLNGKSETVASLTLKGGATSSASPATLILNSNAGAITGSATSGTSEISVNTIWLASLNAAAVHGINVADGEAAIDLDITSILQNGVASAQGINKTGAGTLRLGAINAYTGATNISAGTLQLDGSTAAASAVNVVSGAALTGAGNVNGNATLSGAGVINFASGANIFGTLDAAGGYWNGAGSVTGATNVSGGGTFTVNGTMGGAGLLNVNATGKLAGTGTINKTVHVNSGGTISPKDNGSVSSVGAISTSALNLHGGATYVMEIKDATGNAGAGYDTVNVAAAITVSSSTAVGDRIIVKLTAYPGQLANWNNKLVYHWDIAAGSSVIGFVSAEQFVLDTTDFEDDFPRDPDSYWLIESVGNRIRITYAPEPGASMLLSAIALGAITRRRRSSRNKRPCSDE